MVMAEVGLELLFLSKKYCISFLISSLYFFLRSIF